MNVSPDETFAWEIFQQPELMQESITANLYQKIELEPSKVEYYNNTEFEEIYLKETASYSLPKEYNGYYDKRFIHFTDWDFDQLATETASKKFEEIFNEENGQLQSSITALLNDIDTVAAIKNKNIDVSSFDYNGDKYTSKDCDAVTGKLKKELNILQQQQNILDKESYRLFFHAAKENGFEISKNYQSLKDILNIKNDYIAIAQKVIETIQPLYNDGNTLEFITNIVSQLRYNQQPPLKNQFRLMIEKNILNADKNNELLIRTEDFLKKQYAYFIDNRFQNEELGELRSLVIAIANFLEDEAFALYKYLLTEQLRLYKDSSILIAQ